MLFTLYSMLNLTAFYSPGLPATCPLSQAQACSQRSRLQAGGRASSLADLGMIF